MVEHTEAGARRGESVRYFVYSLTFLSVLSPSLAALALANNPTATIGSFLSFVALYFLPGFLLLRAVGVPAELELLVGPVFGMVLVTTLYNVFVQSLSAACFVGLLVVLTVVAAVISALRGNLGIPRNWNTSCRDVAIAGAVVALLVAPVCWRSGRFSGNSFVFFGPAGQDPMFHLILLQRLFHHVPPDNFMASGLRPPVYHYLNDLSLALVSQFQSTVHFGTAELFDLYYRSNPAIVYFLLGALAFRAGKQLLGSSAGGILSVALLLGAGGLGVFFGLVQVAARVANPAVALRTALSLEWTAWEGVNSILPLVHRPAHYDGLLICLAAWNVLLRPDRSKRDWMIAGLLIGLMAGFNFTLAVTLGLAAVIGACIFALQSRKSDAGELAWFALCIFLGSLPVCGGMLLSGFHYPVSGQPFQGPSVAYAVSIWGNVLGRVIPGKLIPWASMVLFPLALYGVKLFGVRPMLRGDLGSKRHRSLAIVLAVAFVLSFTIGMFFPPPGTSIAIIFLQPTLWILGLFALSPVHAWLTKNSRNWRGAVLWALLGLTWVQALATFNFSHKLSFSQETVQAFQDLRAAASPTDVVAYLPDTVVQEPVLGNNGYSSNFTTMAMTGLDGYYLSQPYFLPFAVPGLTGKNAAEVLGKAKDLYRKRQGLIDSFLRGDLSDPGLAELAHDRVRWIVVSAGALGEISSTAVPWRKTPQVVIYRLDFKDHSVE